MIASDVITPARTLAQDLVAPYRASDTEMLMWLSDAQLAVVGFKPDANAVAGNVSITANSNRQSLPAGGMQLLYITHNMGAGGSTPGSAIRSTTLRDLTDALPSWPTVTGAEVQHYMYDERSPAYFYVYPALTAPAYVHGVYSAAPADVAALSSTLALPDVYRDALIDYVVHRYYLRDAEAVANREIADAAYARFKEKLGVKDTQERAQGPNGR